MKVSAWRGQAALEFALGASMLLLLVVGAVDLARVYVYDLALTTAANEGARAAASGAPDVTSSTVVNGTSVTVLGVQAAAASSAPAGVVAATSVTVTPSQALRLEGQWTTVSVSYTFVPVTPLLGSIVGNSLVLKRAASQRIQANCMLADGSACP